jgi:cobyrinic acid a,c-diamide synthase
MGLVPHQERKHAERAVAWARETAEAYLDMEAIWEISRAAEPLQAQDALKVGEYSDARGGPAPRIGIIRDKSFWFYYPENVSQLRKLGAEIREVDSMEDPELPEVDALYIGGGFPETQAEYLARNESFKKSLRRAIEEGLPVYAECGGLMYMGRCLVSKGHAYPMVGSLPVTFILDDKPQGHGYTILEVVRPNPFFPEGEILKGHEFHYSRPCKEESEQWAPVFKVRRGKGLDGQGDGLCRKNLLATYTHMHAGGNPLWGESLFRVALAYKKLKKRC